MQKVQTIVYRTLKASERFFKTDMIYLAKGGTWLGIGQIISSASAFLIAIAFANLVPKEVYGSYKFILSTVAILSIPTLSGINPAVTQAIARGYEGSFIPSLKAKMKWGLLGSLASIILAGYYFWHSNSLLGTSFIIVAVFIPLMDTFATYGSLLQGKKLFKHTVQYYIVSQLISLVVLVLAIYLSKSLIVILLAYFVPWTVTRLYFLLISLKKFPPNKIIEPTTVSYGKHLSLVGVVATVATYVDDLIVFHYLGPVSVAIYNLAISPVEQIQALFKNLPALALPKFASRSMAEINSRLYGRLFQLFLIGSLFAIGYIVLAPFVYTIFFRAYPQSVAFSQLYAIALSIRLPLAVFGAVTQSKLHLFPKSWLYWGAVPQLLLIAGLFFLTQWFGITGTIFAKFIFMISSFVIGWIQWQLLRKKHELTEITI